VFFESSAEVVYILYAYPDGRFFYSGVLFIQYIPGGPEPQFLQILSGTHSQFFGKKPGEMGTGEVHHRRHFFHRNIPVKIIMEHALEFPKGIFFCIRVHRFRHKGHTESVAPGGIVKGGGNSPGKKVPDDLGKMFHGFGNLRGGKEAAPAVLYCSDRPERVPAYHYQKYEFPVFRILRQIINLVPRYGKDHQ
jgi:hypothetical protein